jgi:ankyrin repeat protein
MSAAVTRSKKLKHETNEFSQPAETGKPGKLEVRPVVEATQVTGEPRSISAVGMTPLMRAACDGLAGTVQGLLDQGAEVNAKRSDGFNALALAAFFGHSQVVWLLLENGADLAATGRSETPPETWADVRGFVDIGDILREARATKQVEAPNPRTAVIDEPARFARPPEKEELQRAGDPGPAVEVSVVEKATASETSLPMRPEQVAEESPERKNESTADIFLSDKPEHAQQQPVIKQPPRVLKSLPEIQDPPSLVVPEFRPGSVFVSRVTSSPKTLVALILAVFMVCGGIAAFLIPQVRKSLADRRTEAVTKTADSPASYTAPSNPVAGSGTNVSPSIETHSATTTESTTAPASKDIEDPTADSTRVESTSKVQPAEVSEKGPAGVATERGSERRAHPSSSTLAGNTDVSGNKPEFPAATSPSRSAPVRKQRAASRAVKFNQQTVVEEQPKPAPLSVESRSRSVLSTPAKSTNEVSGSQPPPLSIISGKPKSKVIQWP